MNKSSKYQKLVFLIACFVIIGLSSLLAQTKTNPFEIKPRLKDIKIEETIAIPSVQMASDTNAIIPNTLVTQVDTSSSSNAKITVAKSKEINPFEVDHVPVRKSTLAKRTENLKSQIEVTQVSNGFLFWFLLFSCALLAIVLNTKNKPLGAITNSIVNENILKLFYREESTRISLFLILLYFIFAINFATFIYLANGYYGGKKGILVFSLILGGVVLIYVFRHIGLNILGKIFEISRNTELFSFTVMVFNLFIGLILLPINFVLAFGPTDFQPILVILGLSILGILLIIRTFRGLFIVSEFLSDRIFQILLYLCAFEIAPMLILIKTLIS